MRLHSPTTEQIKQAVELYASGLLLAAVGQRLGFDAQTIRRVLLRGRGHDARQSWARAVTMVLLGQLSLGDSDQGLREVPQICVGRTTARTAIRRSL